MIVCKFGGTSLQDAEAIERVAGIIKSRLRRKPIVVASAMGRTTNGLLAAAEAAAAGKRQEALDILYKLRDKHVKEAQKLVGAAAQAPLVESITSHFKEMSNLAKGLAILGELTPRSKDAIASFGERLSTLILTEALRERGIPAELVDARQSIITDDNFTRAAPLAERTEPALRQQLLPVVKSGKVPIFQGFIGATRSGVTTTIGRGGSDYSASIVGATLDADEIQIWTDVDGIMTTDPRMVPEARRVKVISFDEAAELAYFGARVLHPATILPAVAKKIPVHVLNSYKPDQEGTLITDEAPACENPIKAIAYKKGITIVNITSTRMLMAHGFLNRIFTVFEQHKTPVDVVTTSEVSVSVTIDDRRHLPQILEKLKEVAEVTREDDMAIVCAVGEGLQNDPTFVSQLLQAIGGVPVRMVSQAASRRNITFVIRAADLPKTLAGIRE